MIPERCMYEFLDGDKKKCIRWLIRFEGRTREEAERDYREYREKLMKSNNFCYECARKERNYKIAQYVRPNEIVYRTDEEIVEMYISGMSFADIMLDTGKSGDVIKSILIKNNVEIRPKTRSWSSLDCHVDTIIKHLNDGKLIKDIAALLGASPSNLANYIRRKNLRGGCE